jgi:hypothetical protein
MDKRNQKRVQVLKDRLQKRRQQLAGARQQPDEPEELQKICEDIDAIQTELKLLEKNGR